MSRCSLPASWSAAIPRASCKSASRRRVRSADESGVAPGSRRDWVGSGATERLADVGFRRRQRRSFASRRPAVPGSSRTYRRKSTPSTSSMTMYQPRPSKISS